MSYLEGDSLLKEIELSLEKNDLNDELLGEDESEDIAMKPIHSHND